MKKLKLKQPYLSNLLRLIQDYKTVPLECKATVLITIDEVLNFYAKQCGYKAIKFLPRWHKTENGKRYLTVKFQVYYPHLIMSYYNFSHFDKIINAHNK